jgi:hypothetical protein
VPSYDDAIACEANPSFGRNEAMGGTWVEYREAELREVVPSGVPDDDPARFLCELRQLRNGAGLEHVELAARAHYPCDAILAAEAGPALPDLPVLSAYVRGCGGTVTDWEERWRMLTRSPALTLLPTRDAGGSDAAAAGARVGSVSLAADAHDPAIIMAALGRVANGIAAEPAPARSLFTPASAAKVAASAAPVLEQASVFAAAPAASSAPAVSSIPRSLTPDPADVAGTAAAPGTARVPGGAGTQGRAPSVVKPVSTAGRAPYAWRPVPSKPLIVAVAILVCLAAIIWALFS